MVDSLDEDVSALKAWIDQAWRRLGQPTLSRLERREMRDQMKKADAALRHGLKQCADRDRIQRERVLQHLAISSGQHQAMRLLNIDGMPRVLPLLASEASEAIRHLE